jgi:hypothetical protein
MSTIEQTTIYAPQDTLYLWWLTDPQSPDLIGDLNLADGNRRVAMTYCSHWQIC